MGYLTVISETGLVPHSACMFQVGPPGSRAWRGFHPVVHHRFRGQGEVDRSSQDGLINHYIRFEVADSLLTSAMAMIDSKYGEAIYSLGVRDCVSMSADVARVCRLVVPTVNMTPYGLIQLLRVNKYTHLDVRPYPW